MRRQFNKTLSLALHSLQVGQTFEKNNNSKYENYEGVGIHAIKMYTYNVDWRDIKPLLTYYNDYTNRFSIPYSSDAWNTVKYEGMIGSIMVRYYCDGKVSLHGSMGKLLYEDNLKLLTPYELQMALGVFSENYFDISSWRITSVEIGIQWWSSLSGYEMFKFWGPYQGKVKPELYKQEGASSADPEATCYYNTEDKMKRYNKSRQLLEKGIELVPRAEGEQLYKFERTFKTRLLLPDSEGRIPRECRDGDRLVVSDLTDNLTYSSLIARFIQSCFDIDKNGIEPKPIESVKGNNKTVLAHRELALVALNNFEQGMLRKDARGRTFLKGLQQQHGDILSENSFWGEFYQLLMDNTIQYAPRVWERFLGRWGYVV